MTFTALTAADVYPAVLAAGPAATERYYDCLRGRGILPTPEESGDLYAPNPVVVDGHIVRWMVDDLNRFIEQRRAATPTPADLLACAPAAIRADFASSEVAAALWSQLQTEPPLAQIDAFLTATDVGLAPAYIEWQTFGAYVTLARWALRCAQKAWPALAAASPVATPGWDLATLDKYLRVVYTRGIEDDPRQGVVLDYRPLDQVTRREFFAIQELTGGSKHGLGILDPRAITYCDGRPHYRRDGALIPIRLAYSRLVHAELIGRLLPESTADERATLRRFFGDPHLHWVSHPLHFYYGSKAHFADFHAAGLSPRLPATWRITDDLLATLRRDGRDPLVGMVFKPALGHGGESVEPDPPLDHLSVGGLLQARILPAACHPTLAGPRIPEVRLMAIPVAGRLAGAALFTRVMAPDDFKSNASHIAACAVPGTGEGYAFTLWPPAAS